MTHRICFIGNAGSGKSLCSSELFVEVKKRGHNAELIPEMIRYDIHKNGAMKSIWEQYRTRNCQREMEDAVPGSVDYVITDSGVLTQYFYAAAYCDITDPRQRLVLQDMMRYLLDDLFLRRYSHIFFIPMGETYKTNPNILNDGTRYQTSEEIETLEIHMDLVFRRLYRLDNIFVLDGSLDTRLEKVLDHLGLRPNAAIAPASSSIC